MEKYCIKCKKATELPVDFQVVDFACGYCGSLTAYDKDSNGAFVSKYNYNQDKRIGLNVGNTGKLYGVQYAVSGLLVKRVHGNYFWREYILTGSKGEKAFLSESNGHWIFLEEEQTKLDVSAVPRKVEYEGEIFKLYSNEKTSLAYAEGFFDYSLPRKSQKMTEYINPPYIVSFELDEYGQTLFVGKHIAAKDVKKAFSVSWMPDRIGVGIVEPSPVQITRALPVFLATALLMVLFHVVIYRNKQQQEVLSDTVLFSMYNQKDYVTKPFTLTGGQGTLRIDLKADVNNSWAFVNVGLVNEATGAEEYVSKDIEYYHGYEGGESWSEGGGNEDLHICGVAPGTYHLVLTPQKDVSDGSTTSISVRAVWNPPGTRNIFIPVILLAIAGFGLVFWSGRTENKRWEDSNYSPYN